MQKLAVTLLLLAGTCGCSDMPISFDAPLAPANGAATGRSTHAGMGATVYAGGTAFRVWAPNATRVFVEGDFNGWSKDATELVSEAGGNFSADVAGAIAGQAYEYVIHSSSGVVERADPRALRMTNSAGASVIVDPASYSWTASGYATPSFDRQVIYEMHLGTFARHDPNAVGTWKDASAKLDYLADLGIDMIEVLPVAEFAGDLSWGYNGSYPFAPESAYGTPDDAKAFIDGAHARGIGVIVDVVHNHYGPSDLSMWCFDGECLGNGNGGVYFYTGDRRESGWGPRPDFGRAEVRDYVVDDVKMWLQDYRADGLRWDSTVNIRTAAGQDNADGWGLLMRANDTVDASQPWKIMIAEDLQSNDWLTRQTSAGGAGFDSQWDAGFFHPIDDTIVKPWDADRSMWDVKGAITHRYNGEATQRVIYTESHDEVANGKSRIPQMIDPSNPGSWYARKRSTLGAAITMTSPGIPMIFMGQEFLQDGWFADTHPLDWSKTQTYSGIRSMYKDLIRLRRNVDGHTAGLTGNGVNVFHVNDGAKVIAFHRWKNGGPGDDVVVIANFSATAFPSYDIGFPRGGTWHVRFNGDWTGYSQDFANTSANDVTAYGGGMDGLGFHGTTAVGPYSVTILSQ
jgi:1,4-alpha-glucan branching enzyme